MALTVTNVGDNPVTPGVNAQAYIPDQLIAGDLKRVTDSVTIVSSAALTRGAVLGIVTASGKYKLAASAAGDGSQTPVAILAQDTDASGGDVVGAPIYLMGEFNANALSLGVGTTLAAAKTALRAVGIFIKTPVGAADPT
jgi:hypothetical protein